VSVLVLIGVVGVGVLGWAVSRPKDGALVVDPGIPAGAPEGYLLGSADAPVQVMEFGDFECPSCAVWSAVTEPDVRERLVKPGTVAFRFYDFPLPMHRNTWSASLAAACASDQGKFWEMHDAIFANQNEWNSEATANPRKPLRRLAEHIGLNLDEWDHCFDTRKHVPRIKGNEAEATRRQVRATPTFIIGSRMIPGNIGYDGFKAYVDSALAESAAGSKAFPGAKAPARRGGASGER
jgi:protein-disulfide isomerase